MIFADKTAFTSPAFSAFEAGHGCVARDVYLTVTGPGPVELQMQQEDGQWRAFPETTFNGPTAQIVSVPGGLLRVVISGGPTTVEVRTQ